MSKKGYHSCHAPVAQLDRASGFEPEGREFESLRARHKELKVQFHRPLEADLAHPEGRGNVRFVTGIDQGLNGPDRKTVSSQK